MFDMGFDEVDDDEDDWVVEGGRRGLARPVESVPTRPGQPGVDRTRLVRTVALTVAAAALVVGAPAAVNWARDNLAEITQVTTTTSPTG